MRIQHGTLLQIWPQMSKVEFLNLSLVIFIFLFVRLKNDLPFGYKCKMMILVSIVYTIL